MTEEHKVDVDNLVRVLRTTLQSAGLSTKEFADPEHTRYTEARGQEAAAFREGIQTLIEKLGGDLLSEGLRERLDALILNTEAHHSEEFFKSRHWYKLSEVERAAIDAMRAVNRGRGGELTIGGGTQEGR